MTPHSLKNTTTIEENKQKELWRKNNKIKIVTAIAVTIFGTILFFLLKLIKLNPIAENINELFLLNGIRGKIVETSNISLLFLSVMYKGIFSSILTFLSKLFFADKKKINIIEKNISIISEIFEIFCCIILTFFYFSVFFNTATFSEKFFLISFNILNNCVVPEVISKTISSSGLCEGINIRLFVDFSFLPWNIVSKSVSKLNRSIIGFLIIFFSSIFIYLSNYKFKIPIESSEVFNIIKAKHFKENEKEHLKFKLNLGSLVFYYIKEFFIFILKIVSFFKIFIESRSENTISKEEKGPFFSDLIFFFSIFILDDISSSMDVLKCWENKKSLTTKSTLFVYKYFIKLPVSNNKLVPTEINTTIVKDFIEDYCKTLIFSSPFWIINMLISLSSSLNPKEIRDHLKESGAYIEGKSYESTSDILIKKVVIINTVWFLLFFSFKVIFSFLLTGIDSGSYINFLSIVTSLFSQIRNKINFINKD